MREYHNLTGQSTEVPASMFYILGVFRCLGGGGLNVSKR